MNALELVAPLFLVLGVAYIGLVIVGIAPQPLGHPAIDERPDDANWAICVAIGATGLGGVLTFATRSRRLLAGAVAVGIVTAVVGALLK